MHRLIKIFLMVAGLATAGCVYSTPYGHNRYESERHYHRQSYPEQRPHYDPAPRYWHDHPHGHNRQEYRERERERERERARERFEERRYYYPR